MKFKIGDLKSNHNAFYDKDIQTWETKEKEISVPVESSDDIAVKKFKEELKEKVKNIFDNETIQCQGDYWAAKFKERILKLLESEDK